MGFCTYQYCIMVVFYYFFVTIIFHYFAIFFLIFQYTILSPRNKPRCIYISTRSSNNCCSLIFLLICVSITSFFYRLQMEIEMKFKTRRSIKDPLLVCPCVFFILLQINVVYSCRYANSFPSLKMFSNVLEIFLILSGNTSMESSLSLLMANLSKVQKNMLVIDPFVGTGEFFISMTTMNSKF